MTKKKNLVLDEFQCPVRNVLDRFGDKWSLLVILTLGQQTEPQRFNKLMQLIGDISQKMLTVTLRTLESDGLILRIHVSAMPRRVEYCLTDLGKTLVPYLEELNSWAEKNQETILKTRRSSVVVKNDPVALNEE